MEKIIYLGTERVKQLRDWVKSHVSSAISALSEVYAPKQHQHTKEDVTDLVDATDLKGGLMTDNQAQKLANIEDGAEKNVIKGIQVNSDPQSPNGNGVVNIIVPENTSDLENDSNFIEDANYVHTDSNYTQAEKSKLESVKENAEPNVIIGIKVNGNQQTTNDRIVELTIPTDNSSLGNGAGYTNESKVKELISKELSGVRGFDYEVVQSLPQTGEKGKFYLIKVSEDGGNDIYDEYIYVDDKFEKIGSKAMSLDGYLQESEIEEMSQETLAGILAE